MRLIGIDRLTPKQRRRLADAALRVRPDRNYREEFRALARRRHKLKQKDSQQ
jgi:hypothetical protein